MVASERVSLETTNITVAISTVNFKMNYEICQLSSSLNQVRLRPTPEVVRSQRITTFQAPMLDVLGKVRDVGHEEADSGGEKE